MRQAAGETAECVDAGGGLRLGFELAALIDGGKNSAGDATAGFLGFFLVSGGGGGADGFAAPDYGSGGGDAAELGGGLASGGDYGLKERQDFGAVVGMNTLGEELRRS